MTEPGDFGRASFHRLSVYYSLLKYSQVICRADMLLLKQPGVQYVYSAKLSQDGLESFFGKQRM